MFRLILILVFLFILRALFSQGGFRTRYYISGAKDNTAKAIFEIVPGSYFAAGFTLDTVNNTQVNRLTVIGLNATGSVQWLKKYGNQQFFYYDNPFITRTFYRSGNFIYYAGCVRDTTNKQIGVLVKFSANGDTIWQKIYRDPDPLEDVIPQTVTASVDGGFLITGFFQNWGSNPYRKCLIIKTDANGNELWRKKIGKNAPDVQDGKAILQDSATKKIVIVGYQYPSGANTHINLLILDSLGNKLNHYATYSGVCLDLIQTTDKKIVLCGYMTTSDQNGDYNQGYIAKYDLNSPLVPIWEVFRDKQYFLGGFACLREKKGNLLVSEWRDSINKFPKNTSTGYLSVSANGTVLASTAYRYKANQPATDNSLGTRAFELCNDDGWVAAIEYFNFPLPNPYLFVKYDSTGCDSTEAYCQNPVGMGEFASGKDGRINIFPNPFQSEIIVENTIATARTAQVIDATGRVVLERELNSARQLISCSGFAKGLYLVIVFDRGGIPIAKTRLVKQD